MDICINLETLAENNLTPSFYAYLLCVYKKIPYICASEFTQKSYAEVLERDGWCKITPTEIILRKKALDLIETKDTSSSLVDSWVNEWRELWPKGVKSAGRPVRGDKQGVLKKMETFCKEYPQYSKSQIFEATRLYIFEKSRDHYRFMTCADYFIAKGINRSSKTSLLAALLEDLDGDETILEKMQKGEGSDWHKEI